jgi:putative membrane protein
MFTELMIATLIGVFAGIITGLTPGVHINLVAAMLLSSSVYLLNYASALSLAAFIISMSVTHTFLDALPSIYLGAPDSDQAMGVLPGHRYLLAGHGMKAVKLTIIGSFGAVILSIVLFPLFVLIVKYGYPLVNEYIAYILIGTALFMLLRDQKRLWALLIFLLSGCLGIIVLNMPNLSNPLFPLLSGLFGVSTLLISLYDKQNIPPQKDEDMLEMKKGIFLKALISGQFSGFITAVLPGLSSSIAAVISLQFSKKLGDQGFMVLIGSIGTVSFILSLATMYVLEKARNGSVAVVQELISGTDLANISIFLCITLIAGGVGVILCLFVGRFFSAIVTKVNYVKLVTAILSFIIVLTFVLTGWIGICVIIVSTIVGILPAKTKVARSHSMGCLLIPVILYFIL